MKEAVDPRSAEGRELQDLLQSQILQIVRTLRKTNLRRAWAIPLALVVPRAILLLTGR